MLATPVLLVMLFQTPDLDALMARVAANIEKTVPARRHYVYTQKIHARVLRSNSKVAREERREYLITPREDTTERKLVHLSGRYQKKGKELTYDSPAHTEQDKGFDAELLEEMVEDVVDDENSRHGIDLDHFPVRTKDLEYYQFTRHEERVVEGRRVVRVGFAPKAKSWDHLWAGETLVDLEDEFPLQIQTKMNRKLPFAVRALLGTDVSQLGFSVTFTRLEKDVWFPRSYGTEFRLKLLFGFNRVVALSMETGEFRKAGAQSTLTYSEVKD